MFLFILVTLIHYNIYAFTIKKKKVYINFVLVCKYDNGSKETKQELYNIKRKFFFWEKTTDAKSEVVNRYEFVKSQTSTKLLKDIVVITSLHWAL